MLTSACTVPGKEMKCRSSTPSLIITNSQHSPATPINYPLMHCTLLLWENSGARSISLWSFFSLPFFHFLIFLEAVTRKKNFQLAVVSTPKINLSNSHSDNMSSNDNRKCWMRLSARLQCRELLLPWAPKNLNSPARRGADYQNWSRAPSASLTRDMTPWFPFHELSALEMWEIDTDTWNPSRRCSDLWSKWSCQKALRLTLLQNGFELKWSSYLFKLLPFKFRKAYRTTSNKQLLCRKKSTFKVLLKHSF